jgi:hypothetical protein
MLAKGISTPLYTLMSGEMKEAKDGVAVLKEVESETFTAFCEYAYTGSYRVPRVTIEFEQSTQGSPSHPSRLLDPQSPVVDYELTEVAVEEAPAEPAPEESEPEEAPAEEAPAEEAPAEEAPAEEAPAWEPPAEEAPAEESTFIWGVRALPVRITQKTDSYTTKKEYRHLWKEFCNLNYDTIPEESEERSGNLDTETEIEFKPLLFHCKLYVFAQMYLMASLKQLTLQKLHAALESFYLNLESSDKVLEVLEFAFTNTERGEDHDGELRKLLVAYAASKTKILKQNASFRTLLDAHGELGSDMVQVLG